LATEFISALKHYASTIETGTPKRPVQRTAEIDKLASDLCKTYDRDTMNAVCLWQLTHALLQHFAKANNTNLDALITLQREALSQWIANKGIPESDAQDALNRLQQSGQTAHYLNTLPD
jgi:hypothetical protein